MNKNKKTQSFYLKYKKCHKLLSSELQNVDNNEYISSRVLDKIIIYLFLREISTNNYNKSVILDEYENSLWIKLLNLFSNNSDNKLFTLVSSTINETALDRKLDISDEVINAIFKEFSKFRFILSNDYDDNLNYISPDILGNVFEKYLNQKDSGAYYTDEDVVRYINKNTIVLSILNKIEDKKELIFRINNLGYPKINTLNDLLVCKIDILDLLEKIIISDTSNKLTSSINNIIDTIKLIDLTCGTGCFLVDAIELIHKIKLIINKKLGLFTESIFIILNIIENSIFGVDIMEDAINIAKFRLLLILLKYSTNTDNQLPTNIKFNFITKNVLTSDFNSSSNIYDNFLKYEKFDCIVGNPPYIEYSKVKNLYFIDNFKTFNCKNIYAYVVERCVNLLNQNGVISLIVPISIISTQRMSYLRELLYDNLGTIFYANFSDRPSTLFNGVHQKTTIITGIKHTDIEKSIYTTKYVHWYNDERKSLFNNLEYIENNMIYSDCYPKIGNTLDIDILNKINNKENHINSITCKSGPYIAYLNDRMCFWVKCFVNFIDSNSFKKIYFETEETKWIYVALMNSSLFYYVWSIYSDGWHITNKEISYFKFDYLSLSKEQRDNLIQLAKELELDLENKKEFIGSKQVMYEYKHKKSKLIIDKIDSILKEYYNLSEIEYNYIIYYNLKFRMNDELGSYLNLKK